MFQLRLQILILFMYIDTIAESHIKKKLSVSYDDYKNLTNMLVLHMRSEEDRIEKGMKKILINKKW